MHHLSLGCVRIRLVSAGTTVPSNLGDRDAPIGTRSRCSALRLRSPVCLKELETRARSDPFWFSGEGEAGLCVPLVTWRGVCSQPGGFGDTEHRPAMYLNPKLPADCLRLLAW